MPPIANGLVRCALVALLTCGSAAPAYAQNERLAQYRAAVTKIFLWKYSAMPIFRQNPVFSGTVLRLDNETIRLASDRCYTQPRPADRYRGINDYRDGMAISRDANLLVQGNLLSKHIAAVEAGTGVKFTLTTAITVSPLSIDSFRPDSRALRKVGSDPECQFIVRLMDGKESGHVLAAEVLHGVIRYQIELGMATSVTAKARSQVLATIGKVFNLTAAEIGVGIDMVSFSVAASPAAQTLAVVPDGFNRAELARITAYLQGKRGADLEIAVQEALTAGDLTAFQKASIRIKSLIGDEIANKERWAERFVGGADKPTPGQLRAERETVDFQKLGTYAAAMELIAPAPPPSVALAAQPRIR